MINRLFFLSFLLLSTTISPHSAQAIPPSPVRVLILGNSIVSHVCQSENGRFADISFLIRDSSNRADSERDFESPAVGAHPGDKGMAEIAQILFDVLYPTRLYLPAIVS